MGSRDLKSIRCSYCNNIFLRLKFRIEENKKLSHNSFCSPKCLAQHKFTSQLLVCENSHCNKEFFRVPNQIVTHSYCSRSCAVVVNNAKFPKRVAAHKICKECKKDFRGWQNNLFCSLGCLNKNRKPYTPESIIQNIKKLSLKLHRVPAKREGRLLAERATRTFGSWSLALIAAGLEPNRSHDHRMYRRSMTKAKDGHVCDSVSEALIDNWLSEHGIAHERNAKYPETKHRADWKIKSGAFIEYFGLAKDSPRYDRSVAQKKQLCKQHNIDLVSLYPNDLYPEIALDSKLGFLMKQ